MKGQQGAIGADEFDHIRADNNGMTVRPDYYGPATVIPLSKPTLPQDSQDRKNLPIYSGVLAYFPAALAYIAKISKFGNDKHNPGEPLHWARNKSTDQLDCIARHLFEVGTKDENDLWHDGMLAWRALANLQELLEKREGAPAPPGAK
jgi:hypothetical protein